MCGKTSPARWVIGLILEHPYITFENNYIETLWWLLKKFYEKGYLYEGYTIQPYSPAAGTGLSSHELNQPGTYKPIRDTSIVAQFKVIRDEKSGISFSRMLIRFILHCLDNHSLDASFQLRIGCRRKNYLLSSQNFQSLHLQTCYGNSCKRIDE